MCLSFHLRHVFVFNGLNGSAQGNPVVPIYGGVIWIKERFLGHCDYVVESCFSPEEDDP